MSMLLRRYHPKPEAGEAETTEVPAGNASKDAWHTYALSQGKSAEDLDGLTRDQIKELFKEPAQTPAEPPSGAPDPGTEPANPQAPAAEPATPAPPTPTE